MEEWFLILVGRELSGSISPAEQLELIELIQQNKLFAQQYNNIRQNWRAAENVGKDFDPDPLTAWQQVKSRLNVARAPVRTFVIRPLYRYLSYAASIILICAAVFYTSRLLLPSSLKIATTQGERRKLILPDHSTVWLNESSRIEYEKDFKGQNNRLVKLQGEAFFEVTKDPEKRFVVEAGTTKTQVYGTSFNIKALANEDLQVALLEGKVAFSDLHDDWTEVLKPGELAYMKSNGLHGKQVFTDTNFMFWKNHVLRFSNQSIQDVLTVIGKSYRTRFILADPTIASQRITVSVKGDSVQQAIDVLQVLLDAHIAKKGDTYIIQSR